MKIVWSVTRSWTPDSCFRLHKPIHGVCGGGNVWTPPYVLLSLTLPLSCKQLKITFFNHGLIGLGLEQLLRVSLVMALYKSAFEVLIKTFYRCSFRLLFYHRVMKTG